MLKNQFHRAAGRVHPFLLWLLGVPIPIIVLILLLRGCMT